MKKLLISLFDHSGNASKYYKEDPNFEVIQIDIKHGIDILTWDYKSAFQFLRFKIEHDAINRGKLLIGQTYEIETGIICMVPCTDYALSGSKHFAAKDKDGRTAFSQLLVAKSKEIIDWFKENSKLLFWQLENPMSRIHTLNPWLGKPVLKFNPCDYALYNELSISDHEEISRLRLVEKKNLTKTDEKFIIEIANVYNKKTWIWGNFNIPEKKRIEPIYKENPGWKLYGGKSERTKELRSITPLGFCKAFYEANH